MKLRLRELVAKARAETQVPFTGEFEERLATLIATACAAECAKVREEAHEDMNTIFLDGVSSGAKRCETYITMLFKND